MILFSLFLFSIRVNSPDRQPAQTTNFNLTVDDVANILSIDSGGLITKNMNSDEAVDPFGKLIVDSWEFNRLDNSKILEPNILLKPDYVQSLFLFDTQNFIRSQNASTFLDAKEKYYRQLKYDFKNKQYLIPQTTLSDWAGLIHPPIKKISENDLDWITKYKGSTLKSKRDTSDFQKSIDSISNSELTSGNNFKPFLDNAVVPELLNIIKNSNHTLWISALLFSCDENTKEITNALIEKAKEGVDVRIMVDRTMQTLQKKNCKKELTHSGIKMILVPGMIIHKSAYHVKLWMSDFKDGIFLGANIIDIQTLSTGFNHLFHDSGLKVNGPVVSDMAQKFLDLWNIYKVEKDLDKNAKNTIKKLQDDERNSGLRGSEHYADWLEKDWPQKGLCRVVTQERHSQRDRVSRTVEEYLKTANKRIWFSSVRRDFHKVEENPQIGYNKLLLTALDKAKSDGVQVEMIFNATTNPTTINKIKNTGLPSGGSERPVDLLLDELMKRSTDTALKDGSKFFEKENSKASTFRAWSYFTYSHIKNLMIDDDFVITGSYNPMDERSTNDSEIALICQDKELNKVYTLNHARDLINSIPYPFSSQSKIPKD